MVEVRETNPLEFLAVTVAAGAARKAQQKFLLTDWRQDTTFSNPPKHGQEIAHWTTCQQ